MCAGLVFAFQSVLMLIVLTYTVGLVESGVFVIAYANANLMHIIGKWGMRNYQVSDAQGEYSFSHYLGSRVITCFIMLVVSALLIIYLAIAGSYSIQKVFVLCVMCLFKLLDAVEDVYTGHYQKCGRLDVGSKCMAFRLVITLVTFTVLTVLLRNLLTALILSTIVSAGLLVIFLRSTFPEFDDDSKKERIDDRETFRKKVKSALIVCLPLFLGVFLSFYVANAHKYAIDQMMNDESQAVFGFLSMPVFIVALLAGFIFNPIIQPLSVAWAEGRVAEFICCVRKQAGYIALIILCVVLVGYFLGLPVLSFFYNTDLSGYKFEFMVLLVAGGFFALASLFTTVITIIRNQKMVAIGYAILAVAALVLSAFVIRAHGLCGAAVLYLCLMAGSAVLFFTFMVFGIKGRNI